MKLNFCNRQSGEEAHKLKYIACRNKGSSYLILIQCKLPYHGQASLIYSSLDEIFFLNDVLNLEPVTCQLRKIMGKGVPQFRSQVKDCELFNVGSTEIWSLVISISSIICVYLAMSNKDGVKSITKEVIVIRVHKTSNKERVDVKNIKDIKSPKQRCSMGKILCSTNDSDDAFLYIQKSLFKLDRYVLEHHSTLQQIRKGKTNVYFKDNKDLEERKKRALLMV